MLDYMVLYQSETGNTKKLATSIFAALPGMAKDLRSIDELNGLPDAATYFVGFVSTVAPAALRLEICFLPSPERMSPYSAHAGPVMWITTIKTSKTVPGSGSKMTISIWADSSVRARCLCRFARNTSPC